MQTIIIGSILCRPNSELYSVKNVIACRCHLGPLRNKELPDLIYKIVILRLIKSLISAVLRKRIFDYENLDETNIGISPCIVKLCTQTLNFPQISLCMKHCFSLKEKVFDLV